ncbi:MAG: hypothetical protein COT74_09895 [Bdellovibrionales bacterium CG10_big_fil_rev_8_21_14_0_10_45_34]|nr:MAG: hypothetical protein COT74_09895 [Bdellovibrionales bacterium CG10_big_fil_rev_8_21_14_0_10_45_34]
MSTPVYRNLDSNFYIFGVSVRELVVLCVLVVFGGELAQFLHIPRAWAFLLAALVGLFAVLVRASLGGLLFLRLLRFLSLPKRLACHLISEGSTDARA